MPAPPARASVSQYGRCQAPLRTAVVPLPLLARHAGLIAVVIVWGGLREGVAVALVLALPDTLPQREAVASGILGLVVWTLIGQGLLVGPVMRWAGIRRAATSGPQAASSGPR
ncbi:MAG TPA: hypothetical protein VGX97_06280 [bacterium]|nr:hypothetical protein [bacterium]